MGSDEAFCLKWNDFQGSISSSLGSLRTTSDLLDVTLQCGTESLQCHRLVLSACSDWFKTVFRALPAVTQHPVIVLWEATARDMALLLDFMYNGEVNVKQENLNSFLALAEKLSVRGLTQGQGGGEKDRDRQKEPVRQSTSVGTPVVRQRQEERGETVKRQRVEQQQQQRVVQQHHEVEEVAVVKQEVAPREEQVVEYDESYQGGEVAQYEGDNMYDNYYEGDDGGQGEYQQTDNTQTMASSKEFPRRGGDCPICHKTTANVRRHVQDVHMKGEFPCPYCGKIFGSKNKQGSHTSRFCSKLFKVGVASASLPSTAGTSSNVVVPTVPASTITRAPATSVIVLPQNMFSVMASSPAPSVQLESLNRK